MKLLIILILLPLYNSDAQWNKVEEIISPLVFSALFSNDNIFAGTDTLYINRDNGLTWQSKLITGQPVDVTALFKAGNTIFAGLYGSGVYISTDNGESWQAFNSGLGGFAEYAKTFVISGDTIFYGTDGGGVYILKPGSSSWQSYNQNLPSNYAWTINDLAVTKTNLIAGAGASGFYYIRPKGSPEWTERRIKTPGGNYANVNTLLAEGDTVFAGSILGIYRSFDNGNNWDSVGIIAQPINVVSFVKYNNRIYAGLTRISGNDFFVWYTDDYGETWDIFDHQFQYLHKLYIYDNKIWAATADGLWFKELTSTTVEPVIKPSDFKVEENYPNPFNPSTNIMFSLYTKEFVSIKVYDIIGNEIAVLLNEEKDSGTHVIQFDAIHHPSGIYFCLFNIRGVIKTKKMMLLK